MCQPKNDKSWRWNLKIESFGKSKLRCKRLQGICLLGIEPPPKIKITIPSLAWMHLLIKSIFLGGTLWITFIPMLSFSSIEWHENITESNKTSIQWTPRSPIYRSNQKIIFSKKWFLKKNNKTINYAWSIPNYVCYKHNRHWLGAYDLNKASCEV